MNTDYLLITNIVLQHVEKIKNPRADLKKVKTTAAFIVTVFSALSSLYYSV